MNTKSIMAWVFSPSTDQGGDLINGLYGRNYMIAET